jgi:flagellar biosynthesis/type III secretory pathway protein FliH
MPLIRRADASSIARDALVLDLGDLAQQGRSIIERAEAEAARIVAEAQAERERLISDASERGYADGHARGVEEGTARGIEEGRQQAIEAERVSLQELQQAWRDALAVFEAQRGTLQLEAEREVLAFAVRLGERVARRAIEHDADAAVQQLAGAIELAMAAGRLRVRVSSTGLEAVRAALPTLGERLGEGTGVVVVEDASLSHGSVVVEADDTVVDATIETQLKRIVEALLPGGAPEGPVDGPDGVGP